ncbi:MAG: MFS transporter, partial [Alphaproteobacteria bacterium]|nr:MFS transporter [Alphaproteobacteria bacterium]
MTNSWANIARAFGHRNFAVYQGGRFFAHTCGWMYRIAIGWMVWKLTGSTAWLGVFALLDQLPALLIMPLAGALTDRLNPLRILRLTQVALLILGVALAALDWLDLVTLPLLIAFTLITGIVSAFQLPANQSVLPHLTPREMLTVAYGLNSVMFNIARFVGPMLAGVTIHAFGTAPAIFANAIGAAIFFVTLVILQGKIDMPAGSGMGKGKNVFRDITDGFSYAMRHPGIGPAIVILFALSMLPFSVELILPSIADGIYAMGATGLAWMSAALGVGAMVQATLIARRGSVGGLVVYGVHGVLALGITFCVLAFSGNFWIALACILVIGFCSSALRVSWMTLLQHSVDPSMRGRVASIFGVITHLCPALGALAVGAIGDRTGLQLVL